MTRPLVGRVWAAIRRPAGGAVEPPPAPGAAAVPVEETDGLAAWRLVAPHLPEAIAPIPEEHLVAVPLHGEAVAPGMIAKGAFRPGSWIFTDRRFRDQVRLKVTGKAGTQSRVIVVQAGGEPSEGRVLTIDVRSVGGEAFVACGKVRRFPSVITVGHGARVEIGDRTSTAGIEIKATGSLVSIGRDCQIGSGTKMLALHFHGVVDLAGDAPRLLPAAGAIRVGNHVWLGEDTRLVAGASIGDGSVLGAFAVLGGTIPPNCVAVGNPARVVRSNRTWSRSATRIDGESMAYIDSLPRRDGGSATA